MTSRKGCQVLLFMFFLSAIYIVLLCHLHCFFCFESLCIFRKSKILGKSFSAICLSAQKMAGQIPRPSNVGHPAMPRGWKMSFLSCRWGWNQWNPRNLSPHVASPQSLDGGNFMDFIILYYFVFFKPEHQMDCWRLPPWQITEAKTHAPGGNDQYWDHLPHPGGWQ